MVAESTLPVTNLCEPTHVPFSDRVCGFLSAAGPAVCSAESCAAAAAAVPAMEWVQNVSSAALLTYIHSNSLPLYTNIDIKNTKIKLLTKSLHQTATETRNHNSGTCKDPHSNVFATCDLLTKNKWVCKTHDDTSLYQVR